MEIVYQACGIESGKEDDTEHMRELDEMCTENPGVLIYIDE